VFELRPHQDEAVAKMHNGCILCGGVGVGKSHTAVAYYLKNEAPKPVLVITTAKKRDKGDWQDLWAEVGMHKDPELTMGAVVIVDSWENITKYKELSGAFVIFDEQRLVGTGAWVKTFYKIAAANRWIMLSATPGDNWLDYVPVFRANGFIKNITQFKEDHVVQRWTGRYYKVIGYRQVPKLVRWRNSLLVDMPYDRHTTRHTHEVAVEYDKDLVRKLVKDRWHVYENRPLTDASELFRVMRRVVYSDASRIQAIRKLLNSHPKLIVFYNFNFELEILRTLADDLSSSQQPRTILDSETSALIESPTRSDMDSENTFGDAATATRSTENGRSPITSVLFAEQQTTSNSDDWTYNLSPKWETTRALSDEKASIHGDTDWEKQTDTSRIESGISTEPWDYLSPKWEMTETRETDLNSCSQKVFSEQLTEQPWDYLLSPEGMRENDPQRSEETGRTLRTEQTSSSSCDELLEANSSCTESFRMTTDTSGHHPQSETSQLQEKLVDTWIRSSQATTPSVKFLTQSKDATDTMPHSISQSSSKQSQNQESDEWQTNKYLSDQLSKSGQKNTLSVEEDSSSLTVNTNSASDVPAEIRNNEWQTEKNQNNPSSTEETFSAERQPLSSEEEIFSTSSKVSKQTKTDSSQQSISPNKDDGSWQQSQKSHLQESNEWQTENPSKFQQPSTRDSKTTEPASDTSTISASSERLAGSQKTSGTPKSSNSSSTSSDLFSLGSGSGSSPQFQVAEWNGHRHDSIPTTTSWVYLVQYVAGAEAWECVETDAICFYSMPYSYKLWWQSHGRIDRLNTSFTDLHYYVLFGGSIIEKAVKKSLVLKKSFNESAFAAKMGFWQK